jgi:hypothetical protein
MSGAKLRLQKLAAHFLPSPPSAVPDPATTEYQHRNNLHALSPTLFLPRTAAIEPNVCGNALEMETPVLTFI